ncbi:MAG: hypothetical protein AUG17_06430 [Crenarchaeota archaeon 13_1_20CM_2_53_14]|nr:MAG: hypothetical protein AUG17_06430 [Crenarchaeota archaeon 13_1_20CM_2_53_14]
MRNESILVSNGIFAAVYMAVAFSSLRLFATLNASASPVWPPTGLAIAALLIWGPRLWPGIYIGAFAANSLTSGPITSIAIAAGNTLEAFMAFWLVVRFAHGVHAFNGARSLGVFVLAAGLAAPLVSATVGTTSLAADGLVQWSLYGVVWTTWWLGDASGALIVAPLIISFVLRPKQVPVGGLRELVLLILVVLIAGATVFAPLIFSSIPPVALSFTVVPIIVWAGLRFGSRGATGATFLFSTIAIWGTLGRLGPYGSGSTNTALLSLQFSIMVLATVGLALSALVHERLDAQEEARKARAAESRFETLVDSAPDAMVIADAQGRIVQVNSQTEALFGYAREEVLNLKVEDLIPQRFRTGHVAHRADFHATPRRREMGVGMELYGLRKDGTEFPVEISLSPLQSDSGVLVSSAIRDISERRRVEEERARLAAIVETSSDAIIKETLDGTIVSWNKGAERIFGYSTLEAVGQKGGILMPSGENGESEILERLKRDGRILPYETRLTRKDGASIDVSLSVTSISDPTGRTIGASILIQDISEKKLRRLSPKGQG